MRSGDEGRDHLRSRVPACDRGAEPYVSVAWSRRRVCGGDRRCRRCRRRARARVRVLRAVGPSSGRARRGTTDGAVPGPTRHPSDAARDARGDLAVGPETARDRWGLAALVPDRCGRRARSRCRHDRVRSHRIRRGADRAHRARSAAGARRADPRAGGAHRARAHQEGDGQQLRHLHRTERGPRRRARLHRLAGGADRRSRRPRSDRTADVRSAVDRDRRGTAGPAGS